MARTNRFLFLEKHESRRFVSCQKPQQKSLFLIHRLANDAYPTGAKAHKITPVRPMGDSC